MDDGTVDPREPRSEMPNRRRSAGGMAVPRRKSDGMSAALNAIRPRAFSVRDMPPIFQRSAVNMDEHVKQHAPGRRASSHGPGKVDLAPMVAAADDAPMMIICFNRETAELSYINKEVYRVLGPDACIGAKVETLLDGNFRSERSLEACRELFGISEEMVMETKKSSIELHSAAGNTLPAVLVMRSSPTGEYCTATVFPGHGFQADFLEWQTAKTYRQADPQTNVPITDIGSTSHVGQPTKPIFVEMDELRKIKDEDTVEWREVAHWKDGLEQSVAEGKDGEMQFGRAHLSTVKFHDFLLLRKLVQRGTVLIDLDVLVPDQRSALNFIASAIVNDLIAAGSLPDERRDEVMQVIQAQHKHATERKKKKIEGKGDKVAPSSVRSAEDASDPGGGSDPGASSAAGQSRIALPPSLAKLTSRERADPPPLRDAEDEACDVLAGTLTFMQQQVAAFVRLKTAVDLGDFTEHEDGVKPPPVRFVFIVLGPPEAERENHNVGHAIACMMSNKDFANKAQVLRNKDDLLETIDGSIDHTNLTFAQNIETLRERAADAEAMEGGCCGLFARRGDDPFAIEMDGGMPLPFSGRRKAYSAVTIVEVPVSAAPPVGQTYEVKTIEKPKNIIKLSRRDMPVGFLVLVVSLFCVILMTLWHPHEQRRDVLTSKLTRFNTYITSPLFAVQDSHPLVLPLSDEVREVVDIKLVAACTSQDCGGSHEAHRRQLMRRGLASVGAPAETIDGATWVQWELVAGGVTCEKRRFNLQGTKQVEALATVDLRAAPCAAEAVGGEDMYLAVTTDADEPLSVLAQPILVPAVGRHRIVLGGVLFVITFAGIVSEVIHRCYVTFIGAFFALALVAWTHEVPEIPTVISMIDAGTLMLLFAMMVNVHLLSLTGFFQWFAVRMVELARGNVMVLFFLLTNMTGVLSAFLDNVTCVLLMGPVTIKLCEQMGMNPVPFYLTETLAATIGGTATLIGDPPNVVIGNKLNLRFNDFIIFNGPLVVVIMPLATVIQYYRFKDSFPKENVLAKIDLADLKADNKIHDERSLFFLSFIFLGIFLGLFLFELHGHEPAWFCLLGMIGASLTTSRHDIRHAIAAVEWDTLLFFAGLFVFVESLAELGLIRFIGGHMSDFIKTVEIENRLTAAMVLFLWVSAIGSAFLESLPYTTTITFIILNLVNEDDLGIPIMPLAWALSVGACVGGIGSIMGSSANLVSIGVSERYSPGNPIKGKHFFQYGFPLLLVSISIATLYQWVLFVQIAPYK